MSQERIAELREKVRMHRAAAREADAELERLAPRRPAAPGAYYGGSFAPPLDAAGVAAYRALAASAGGYVGEAMSALCDMVEVFRQTPDSPLEGVPHRSGVGLVVPLEAAEVARIWDVVPYAEEIEAYRKAFDTIPTEQKALRDAAHHLLWYAIELEKDRQPLTCDKITR